MTILHTTREWKCDLCDGRKATPHDVQPEGWVGITVHPLPQSADVSERLHVCATCCLTAPFSHLIAATKGCYR